MTPEHKEKLRLGRERARAERAAEDYVSGGERESRASEARPAEKMYHYRPPGTLPEIDPGDGFSLRWVRREVNGNVDATNWQARMREGWEPIPIGDAPEVAGLIDSDGSGLISIGGLVACRAPKKLMDSRAAYYSNFVRTRASSLNDTYLSMRDKGVKVYNETPPRGGSFNEDS